MDGEKKEKVEIVIRKKLVVNYDQSAQTLALPKLVREASEDLKKVKLQKTGESDVSVILVKLDFGLTHKEVKQVMSSLEIVPAGLHELIIFSHFLEELFRDGMRIVSLRDEMFEMGT